MMKYLLLDPAFCPMEEQGRVSVGKRFCIHRPAGATLYLNGRAVGGESENAWISASSLRKENTVQIELDGITYLCQGFAFDGTTVTALPQDANVVFGLICRHLLDLKARVDTLETASKNKREKEEKPLFS